jgi:MFS family permease
MSRTVGAFLALLRTNRNYRHTWIGQIVSEVGDHFNNIAVFSLVLEKTGSGLVVAAVLVARAVPAVIAGPVSGVALDRFDRRRIMVGSDLIRAVVALGFVLTVHQPRPWLLYVLSAGLMFASPFFTSGRSAILPVIARSDEIHTANSLTQTTQWTTLTIGTYLAGAVVSRLGYSLAFVLNATSFLFSAWSISRLVAPPGGFRAKGRESTGGGLRGWQEYVDGLRYMRSTPLVMAIALVGVGWASGGGAAQILFSLFGQQVFQRGPAGIGTLWAAAGVGLICGGTLAHSLGSRLSFVGYKRAIVVCYVVHGAAYIWFSQMTHFGAALVALALSRAAVAISSVLNYSELLQLVRDEYRGRVFSTMESMTWATMMLSMMLAGVASLSVIPRVIAAWSGALSSTTALFWGWAHVTGRLPKPAASRRVESA